MRKIQNSLTLLPQNSQHQPKYERVNCCLNGTTGSSIHGSSSINHSGGGNAGSECVSSNSSFSDDDNDGDGASYSSGDESSLYANWEEHVNADGKLFYIEFMPYVKKTATTTASHDTNNHVEIQRSLRSEKDARTSKIKSRNGISARRLQQQQPEAQLAKQQHKLQQQQKNQKHSNQCKNIEPTYKFSSIAPQDVDAAKVLELVITAADRYRFGRRSTAVESILGFRVAPFVDQPECLMVLDFVHDMPTLQQHGQQLPVQRGDWFQRLDDIDIRACNINELLLQFNEPTKVCLKFQGPSGSACGNATPNATAITAIDKEQSSNGTMPLRKLENFQKFSQTFEELLNKPYYHQQDIDASITANVTASTNELLMMSNANTTTAAASTPIMKSHNDCVPFALLILPPECCQMDEHRNSLYFYPEDAANNFLYKTRGSFLTLNAVFGIELKTPPVSSNISYNNEPYTVYYRRLEERFLVLIAFARRFSSVAEGCLRSDELIDAMRFTFLNLTLENLQIDNIKTHDIDQAATSAGGRGNENSGRAQSAPNQLRIFLRNFCDMQRVRLLSGHRRCGVLFEELLQESRLLSLPKEAQLRIFDALSEMEAMDYRSWNDEPLHTHREFFIYGSALYCEHLLLVSQLPVALRASVEAFIRCHGIFDFISEQPVKSLYVWQEIKIDTATSTVDQKDRYFLSLCARNRLLLAVVLKMFDVSDDMAASSCNIVVPPSLFYIEEIQETLDHFIQCGIESLAMFWAISNKRPEIWQRLDALSDYDETKSHKDTTHKEQSSKFEAFIKQRLYTTNNSASNAGSGGGGSSHPTYDDEAHLCSSLGGSSSVYSLTPSEDENSRQQQMPNSNSSAGCDSDSGSDWEHFNIQLHDSTTKVPSVSMTESLYKEINNILPINITPGWRNSLYYYVYIDHTNGTIFSPFRNDSFNWLSEMRSAFLTIREVFLRTKSARRLMQQPHDTNTNAMSINADTINEESTYNTFYNKELCTIKEYSITINVRDPKKPANGPVVACFTVSGRLFTGKEVYICHHPDIPQNMVETMFRLSFFSAG